MWYTFLAGLAGALLVSTSVLKAYQLAYFGITQDSLLRSSYLSVPALLGEFLLGLWLLIGWQPKTARAAAIVGFFGLLEVSLWQALSGKESCGCMGAIKLNPWYVFCLDAALLSGLVASRPRPSVSGSLRAWAFILAALSISIPGVLMITLYKRDANLFTDLRGDRILNSKIDVDESVAPDPTRLMQLVAETTGRPLTVDKDLEELFFTSRPDTVTVNHRQLRCWAIMELISRNMPVPARWVRGDGGYTLILDSPLARTRHLWLASLSLGGTAFAGIYFWARRRTTADALPQ